MVLETNHGLVPVISTEWNWRDYPGALMVRLDVNRINYSVAPGLYAAGKTEKDSPILVSANYKLSFDVLRAELKGLSAWVLVIDTDGVNVWCATAWRTGRSGASCEIRLRFSSTVRSCVCCRYKKYLAAGMKDDAAMRRVTFGAIERLKVAWLELVLGSKVLTMSALILLINAVLAQSWDLSIAWNKSLLLFATLWGAIFPRNLYDRAFAAIFAGASVFN